MIIYGNRLFGKVDAVPGVGFVATKFFHIDYVPLVPSQSWLVFQQSGKSWRGVRIPLSAKSVLLAWLRTVAVVVGAGGIIGLIVVGTGRDSEAVELVKIAGVSCAGWAVFAFTKLHKSVTRASYARACQLAKIVKMNDKGLAAMAAVYGQPPISFGFAPVVAMAGESVGDAAALVENPLEAIPVEELDDNPTGPSPTPTGPASITPRQETRRHG